jgi:hypothetical protein
MKETLMMVMIGMLSVAAQAGELDWSLSFPITKHTRNYSDTNGFFVVQFDVNESFVSRPATFPEGVPHYDAVITVFKVVDGKMEKVCPAWSGEFTDGKCYEDKLSDLVAMALKKAGK